MVQEGEDEGKLDNTLIISSRGDNGASPEGTMNGIYREFTVLNGVHQRPREHEALRRMGHRSDLPPSEQIAEAASEQQRRS